MGNEHILGALTRHCVSPIKRVNDSVNLHNINVFLFPKICLTYLMKTSKVDDVLLGTGNILSSNDITTHVIPNEHFFNFSGNLKLC